MGIDEIVTPEIVEMAAKAMTHALNEAEPDSAEWWGLDNDERDLALDIARAALLAVAPALIAAEREACAQAVERRAVELDHKECCGNGVPQGFGEEPPECCGDPVYMISNVEAAAAAIRDRGV